MSSKSKNHVLDPNSDKRNIVMLTPYPPMCDGVGDYAYALVSSLKSRCRFHILTPGHGRVSKRIQGPPAFESLSEGTETVVAGWGKGDFLYPLCLARTILALGPSAVHIQHVPLLFGRPAGLPLIPVILSLRLKGLPVIVTLHSILPFQSRGPKAGKIRGKITLAAYALSTRLTCTVSSIVQVMKQSDAETLVRDFHVPIRKIVVIPHFTRYIESVPARRSPVRLELPGALVIGCFGFADPGKGLDNAIRAVALLRTKLPCAHLVFVGGFNENQSPVYRHICRQEVLRLQALAARLGLKDLVHFFTDLRHEDLPLVLSAVDVFWFPYPGGGGVSGALHVIAKLGKPVIVTQVPKFEEIIHGRNGLKIPPGSPEALVEATILLHGRPDLARSLGEGLAASLGTLDQRDVAAQLMVLYESLHCDSLE